MTAALLGESQMMLMTGLFSGVPREPDQGLVRSWSYIGRFVWKFSWIEYQVGYLFAELFGGGTSKASNAAAWLLEDMFDLRKQLRVIDEIMKSSPFHERKTFKRIHALHDVRNDLAHLPFDEDADGSGIYSSEFDKFFTYAELDSYDAELSTLFLDLEKLLYSDAATPITDLSAELQVSIERAISSSDNTVRFPSRMQPPNRQDAGWEPIETIPRPQTLAERRTVWLLPRNEKFPPRRWELSPRSEFDLLPTHHYTHWRDAKP
jgi:hypothetical protein